MRIQANAGMMNNGIHMERVNQQLAKGQESLKSGNREERKDRVSFGRQEKGNNFIKSLMEQKQNVTDQKNRLIGRTLEKGGSMDSIKSELEMYDQQMKNLDQQISETMTKDAEKQTEKAKEAKEAKDNKPKTEEEIQNEKMANLSQQASGLEQMEIIDSAQTKIEGQVRVLKAEIKSGNGPTESKMQEVAELGSSIDSLAGKMSDVMSNVSDMQQTAAETQEQGAGADKAGSTSGDISETDSKEPAKKLSEAPAEESQQAAGESEPQQK